MHNASLEFVRYALAILMFMSRCTRMYFCLLCSYCMDSMQTGAPYNRRTSIAPLYMVCSASCETSMIFWPTCIDFQLFYASLSSVAYVLAEFEFAVYYCA